MFFSPRQERRYARRLSRRGRSVLDWPDSWDSSRLAESIVIATAIILASFGIIAFMLMIAAN